MKKAEEDWGGLGAALGTCRQRLLGLRSVGWGKVKPENGSRRSDGGPACEEIVARIRQEARRL